MPYTVRMIMKRFCFAVLAVMLSGCAASDGVRTDILTDEFETDYSTVYVETLSVSGSANPEYEEELNTQIGDEVKYAVSSFDSLAQEAEKNLPEGVKSALRITQDVKRNSGGFLSVIEEHYMFTGGAHGNTAWYPRNIYILSEDPHNLSLGELFSEDDYINRLNIIIEREVSEDPERYSELWDKPVITEENQNNYYVTDEDLVIFFPPYTLSYYAKGFIEFDIKLTEIEGMINDKYKNIAINN